MAEKDNLFLFFTGVSSVCSSMIAKVFVHPLDTIKAKMQIEASRVNSSNMKGSFLKTCKY